MEQFKNELVWARLNQWADRVVTEWTVGFTHHALEICLGNLTVDERCQHSQRDIHIGFSAQIANLFWSELWVFLWKIEAAIAGKSGEQSVAEPQNRCFAARADIFHLKGLHFGSMRILAAQCNRASLKKPQELKHPCRDGGCSWRQKTGKHPHATHRLERLVSEWTQKNALTC